MWVALLPLLVGALQFRGLSTEAGRVIAAKEPKEKPTEDDDDDTTTDEKSDIKAIRAETDATKEMIQSMLVANSQQMSSLNNIYQETHKMREGYDSFHENIMACKRELADLKATSREALEDSMLMDSTSFIQMEDFNSAKKSLEETRQKLEKLVAML